jgi:tRNA pseudouridine55 synthase
MNAAGGNDGIMLVSKPAGVTSHDVVARARLSPLVAGRKVGHSGTLDPFATGLLLLLVGKATRVHRYLVSLPKTYRTEARLGAVSDTGDPTGELTSTGRRAAEPELREALRQLEGTISQRVPLTSAVKVGGERLYKKARRGERFETPVRDIHVSRLELIRFDQRRQAAILEVDCSSGTYVRQLVSDLGELCGSGAYCEQLERLAIGPFKLAEADERRLIPLVRALDFLPERRLTADETLRAANGAAIEAGEQVRAGQPVRLTFGRQLVAVAERRDGQLKPVTVLT